MFLLSGFFLGLASSFHCIGMCGPISMALPLNRRNNFTKTIGILSFHFARILSYSLLGLLIGSIGFSIRLFHVFQVLSVVFGIGLILLAWRKTWIHKLRFTNTFLNQIVAKGMSFFLHSDKNTRLFGLGFFNGLLPCGMTLVALGTALLAPNTIASMSFMILFGFGTLPALFAVAFLSSSFSTSLRAKMTSVFPYLLSLVAVIIILRGSNLGIPYLSPKLHDSNEYMRDQRLPFTVECHSTPTKN